MGVESECLVVSVEEVVVLVVEVVEVVEDRRGVDWGHYGEGRDGVHGEPDGPSRVESPSPGRSSPVLVRLTPLRDPTRTP